MKVTEYEKLPVMAEMLKETFYCLPQVVFWVFLRCQKEYIKWIKIALMGDTLSNYYLGEIVMSIFLLLIIVTSVWGIVGLWTLVIRWFFK